jgi:diguanylate cyclase (GGDEF)-like protein
MMDALATRDAERLLIGRIAGLLFLAGSLMSIPVNTLFSDPTVTGRSVWVTLFGVVSGLVCLALPWDRWGMRALHLVTVAACLEVALTMWGVVPYSEVYLWFLVLVVVFAGYAFDSRRAVAAHLGLALAVSAYPTVITNADRRMSVIAETLVAGPVLLITAIVVVHLRERLQAQQAANATEARRDPLTGAGNRRLLGELLGYEVTRHRRNGQPLSLVVFDLDHFKPVNDTFGHPAGDRLLCDVADALRATLRDQDTLIRQGGDEFCIVAPETGSDEAAALAARAKDELRRLVALGEPLSASAGHATFPVDAPTADLLLAHADTLQRRDKAVGRTARPQLQAL